MELFINLPDILESLALQQLLDDLDSDDGADLVEVVLTAGLLVVLGIMKLFEKPAPEAGDAFDARHGRDEAVYQWGDASAAGTPENDVRKMQFNISRYAASIVLPANGGALCSIVCTALKDFEFEYLAHGEQGLNGGAYDFLNNVVYKAKQRELGALLQSYDFYAAACRLGAQPELGFRNNVFRISIQQGLVTKEDIQCFAREGSELFRKFIQIVDPSCANWAPIENPVKFADDPYEQRQGRLIDFSQPVAPSRAGGVNAVFGRGRDVPPSQYVLCSRCFQKLNGDVVHCPMCGAGHHADCANGHCGECDAPMHLAPGRWSSV